MRGSGEIFDPREPVEAKEYLASLPPVREVPDLLSEIREQVENSRRYLAVLDDDPTGTQTVHDVPVLTEWSKEELRWALEQPSKTFYILTNSRSFSEKEAVAINEEIATNLARAATEAGVDFAVTSRSDSTLRGHFPAEPDVLVATLETESDRQFDGVIVCPAFFEAGRLTVDDVHWVDQGEELVPAGLTEYASDSDFGYSSSNLRSWVEEKTKGRIPAKDVLSVGIDDIRQGGSDQVREILSSATDGQPVVVNSARYEDLEVFVLGLLAAEEEGKTFIYRTGPSFVRARGGIPQKSPLEPEELYRQRPHRGPGLILVGSHVDLTTRQLEEAAQLDGLRTIELSVPRLIDPDQREAEISRVSGKANEALAEEDVLVYTSREVVSADENRTGLELGQAISVAVVEVMRRVDRELSLGFVAAKGGITSSDVGTKGLNVKRAKVAGQMLAGIIPVWILPEDSDFPGIPYVVFPGNVGDENALKQVIEILREE